MTDVFTHSDCNNKDIVRFQDALLGLALSLYTGEVSLA